jgi:hypothetical protein
MVPSPSLVISRLVALNGKSSIGCLLGPPGDELEVKVKATLSCGHVWLVQSQGSCWDS